ncbi:MAG TPA: MarR family transcriptional regulator [Gaiellaceae bacterium]|jgi:DNA-binding MarR family transcriptional regulator
MSPTKTPTNAETQSSLDTVALADRLRPVLMRVSRELRREARAAGISPGSVTLLVAIQGAPGIGVNELAERERMSPAGMSQQIERLVNAGYVARTPSEADRRRIGLTLTEDGRRVLRQVRSRRTLWLARRLGALAAEDLRAIEAAAAPLALLLDGEGGRL